MFEAKADTSERKQFMEIKRSKLNKRPDNFRSMSRLVLLLSLSWIYNID